MTDLSDSSPAHDPLMIVIECPIYKGQVEKSFVTKHFKNSKRFYCPSKMIQEKISFSLA